MTENPLGRNRAVPDRRDPSVLHSIPRRPARDALDLEDPVHGADHWRAYELSWLDGEGRPVAATGEFVFDAGSAAIVESKSLKLYLNGFNLERYESADQARRAMARDLSEASGAEATVRLRSLGDSPVPDSAPPPGRSIDAEVLPGTLPAAPDAALLGVADGTADGETLRSDLFRSNCPVTAAPDWASVVVRYSGRTIDAAGLLAYLCSFRRHQAYHEECAERAYCDIMRRCRPRRLEVAFHFLRRGGLEINAYRGNAPFGAEPFRGRLVRQ